MNLIRDISLGICVGFVLALMIAFDVWPLGEQSVFDLGRSPRPVLLDAAD
jgi:hypothetical protein